MNHATAELFAKIQELLPHFKYKELRVWLDTTADDDYDPSVDLVISFKANGRTYTNEVFYDFIDEDYDGEQVCLRVGKMLLRGVNLWLTDQKSEQRIFSYKYKEDEETEFGEVVLLLMNQEQTELWKGYHRWLFPSQDFTNVRNSKWIDKQINILKKYKFLNHLTKEEMASGRREVVSNSAKDLQGILYSFPKNLVFF